MKKLVLLIAAADLFYLDVSVFEEFARSNSLLPLDSYLKGINIKDFPQPLIDGFTFNNRIYGIAKDFSTLTLKAKGVETPVIMNADFNRLIPFINAFGGQVTDANDRIAFSNPKTKAAIQFYVNLVTKDKVGAEASNVGAGWEGEAFGKGNAAMILPPGCPPNGQV